MVSCAFVKRLRVLRDEGSMVVDLKGVSRVKINLIK